MSIFNRIVPPSRESSDIFVHTLNPGEEKKLNSRCKIVLRKGSFELASLCGGELELNCRNGNIFVQGIQKIIVVSAGVKGCEFSCEYDYPEKKTWPTFEGLPIFIKY